MVQPQSSSLNALWAELIVEELLRNNIYQFVLSSGSRCAPLTSAIASNDKSKKVTHFDERGAAFFALGYAKATDNPAVLVCTSGTAAANFYPAVVEAAMDMAPLLLLTADRPPELRDTGANQTIDQANLYGKYVRSHFALPCPDEQVPPEFILTTIDQAIYRATSSPKGPVHINCMFREPLAPSVRKQDFSQYLLTLQKWSQERKPFTTYEPSENTISESKLERVASIIKKAKHGLMVIGHLKTDSERAAACRLSQELNWPIFADIRSDLRLGAKNSNVIAYFDQLLLSDKFKKMKQPTVVHLGGVPTSKRWQLFSQRCEFTHYIHIADHPFRHDPGHRVTARMEANLGRFCQRLIPMVENDVNNNAAFLKCARRYDKVAGEVIESFISDSPSLTEPAVARLVSKYLARERCLFLGSSMPIRDMDMYADPDGESAGVAANRGASGIDGGIATFIGYTSGLDRAGTLLIGDLAFLYDLNSLALLKKVSHPLTIVVINNNGGGIFSFLPVVECEEIFEPFFGTPHNLTFEKAAAMFDLDYYKPDSKESFISSYQQAQTSTNCSIIEIQTNREENRTVHMSLQDKIKSALDNL